MNFEDELLSAFCCPDDNRSYKVQVVPGLPEMLLWKSATLVGFFLLHYATLYKKHLQKLVASWQSGKLHISMDGRQFRSGSLTPTVC